MRDEINHLFQNMLKKQKVDKKGEIKVCSLDEMKNVYFLCKEPINLFELEVGFPTDDNNAYNQMVEIFEKSFTGRNSEEVQVTFKRIDCIFDFFF